MTGEIAAAVGAELLKVRRSLVPWVTVAAFALAGLVGAFFMFVLQDPARARALGLLGSKAQLTGSAADWAGHLALTAQIVALGGLLVFGVIVIWLFGREFADRTATDLLALPAPRSAIVVAKLLVALGWSLLLTLQLVALTLVSGAVLGLPGWSWQVARGGVGIVVVTALLTTALATTYGLVACLGRGYLPAMATMLASLFAAQVVAALGFGEWFPWSVPALISGVAGPDQSSPGAAGVLGVVLVGVLASGGTVFWWQHADQT